MELFRDFGYSKGDGLCQCEGDVICSRWRIYFGGYITVVV